MISEPRPCSIDGCGRKHFARGWCKLHYQRWKVGGDMLAPVGCHQWEGYANLDGYGVIRPRGGVWVVHRLAGTLTRGPVPEGAVVLHSRGNRLCINVDHMRLGTFSETEGRRGVNRRLRADQVQQIRERYAASGLSQRKLAADFGVTAMAVNRIVNGRTYRTAD